MLIVSVEQTWEHGGGLLQAPSAVDRCGLFKGGDDNEPSPANV